jgi:small neutral amino acid transporter SnatA (MarC family)
MPLLRVAGGIAIAMTGWNLIYPLYRYADRVSRVIGPTGTVRPG